MKRTHWYAAMTKDEAQHSRKTFYFAVNLEMLKDFQKPKTAAEIAQEGCLSKEITIVLKFPDFK